MTATTPAPTYESMQEYFRGMRENEPVKIDHDQKTVEVFRYDDVYTVLTEHRDYQSDLDAFMPKMADSTNVDLLAEGNFSRMDEPAHKRLRGLVSKVFTPRMISELEPRIASNAKELLAQTGSEFDVVEALAYPLPISTIAEILGVPASDREVFQEWADFLLSQSTGTTTGMPDEQQMAKIVAFMGQMNEYLLEHISRCRKNPGTDLTSQVCLAVADDGKQLTDSEIVGFIAMLLMAGHLTTTALICSSVLLTDAHPDVAAELRADRELIPQALDEFLRFRSPSARMARQSTRELSLGGVTVPANYMVLAWLASANRDPRQFTDPDTLDIHRSPNQHMGFGKGIHFCLGAPLARLQARVALNHIFDRYTRLEVDGGAEYFPNTISAVKRLPVIAHY